MQYIHGSSPKTQIVLLGVLPRGAQYWEKDQAWIWPNRYTDAIAAVNAGYYVSARPSPLLPMYNETNDSMCQPSQSPVHVGG